jgi:hypothetical protein
MTTFCIAFYESYLSAVRGMGFRLHAHESTDQPLRLAGRTSTHGQDSAGSIDLLGPEPALCPSMRTLAQAQWPVSPGMLQARAQLFPSVQGQAVAKLARPLVVTAQKMNYEFKMVIVAQSTFLFIFLPPTV